MGQWLVGTGEDQPTNQPTNQPWGESICIHTPDCFSWRKREGGLNLPRHLLDPPRSRLRAQQLRKTFLHSPFHGLCVCDSAHCTPRPRAGKNFSSFLPKTIIHYSRPPQLGGLYYVLHIAPLSKNMSSLNWRCHSPNN